MIDGLGGLLGGVARFGMEALGGPFQKIVDRQVMSGLLDQQGQGPLNMGQLGEGLLAEGYAKQGLDLLKQEDRQAHQQAIQQQAQQYGAAQNQLYNLTAAQQQANMDRQYGMQQQVQQRLAQQAMMPEPIGYQEMVAGEKLVQQHGELADGIGVLDRGTQLLEHHGFEAKGGLFERNSKAAQAMQTLDNQVLAMLTKAQQAGALGDDERAYYQEVIGGDPNAWFSVNGAKRKIQAYRELKSLLMVKANRAAAFGEMRFNRPGMEGMAMMIRQNHKDEWVNAGTAFDPSKYARIIPAKERKAIPRPQVGSVLGGGGNAP